MGEEADKEELIEEIINLYWESPHDTGFKERTQIEDRLEAGNVTYSRNVAGEIVCVADYRHLIGNEYTTVYATALKEGSGDGYWFNTIGKILRESPHNRLRTKVPIDSNENLLWRQIGRKVSMERGKNKPLYVWIVDGNDKTTDSSILEW